MKSIIKNLSLISFVIATGVLINSFQIVKADYEVYGENGEFIYPDNTKCTVLDKTKRIIDAKNNNMTFYEMCLGSFPKYASTQVEEGLQPIYYAKYYFYPDPMPIYADVSNEAKDSLGNNTAKETYTKGKYVDGLGFKAKPVLDYEKKDDPSYHGIYYLYPYNDTHKQQIDRAYNQFVNGPYQLGYNSFYHNAYRSRNFAQSVDFDFKIYEPYNGGENNSKLLFEGKIVYELDENCYNEDYLVYADNCTEIEFYFPKGEVIDKSAANKDKATANDGKLVNVFTDNAGTAVGNEQNAVPDDRVHYRNPGVHKITLEATEKLGLRLQQDIGTEYQTKGNKESVQDVRPTDENIYYFEREDLDIFGNSIIAKNNIVRVVSELYREGNDGKNTDGEISTHNGKIAISAQTISNEDNYTITKNNGANENTYDAYTNFLNYCTINTDVYGDANESRKIYNGTSYLLSPKEQKESTCYHNQSREYHFWQYAWSKTTWYHTK